MTLQRWLVAALLCASAVAQARVPLVLLTDFGTQDGAVSAMKGAGRSFTETSSTKCPRSSALSRTSPPKPERVVPSSASRPAVSPATEGPLPAPGPRAALRSSKK